MIAICYQKKKYLRGVNHFSRRENWAESPCLKTPENGHNFPLPSPIAPRANCPRSTGKTTTLHGRSGPCRREAAKEAYQTDKGFPGSLGKSPFCCTLFTPHYGEDGTHTHTAPLTRDGTSWWLAKVITARKRREVYASGEFCFLWLKYEELGKHPRPRSLCASLIA